MQSSLLGRSLRAPRSLAPLGLACVVVASGLGACGDSAPLRPDAASEVEVVAMRAVPNRDLDIIVVMDDSVLDLQTAVKAEVRALLDIVDTLDGGRPSLQIGVTTTDLGTTGSLAPSTPAPSIGNGPGSCSGLGRDGRLLTGSGIQGTFIQDLANTDGTRTTNFTGSLESALAGLLSVGANGCGFEQPLRAMERAFANPANAAFFRPTANLATLIVTDEDDCSLRDAALLSASDASLGALQSFRCTSQGIVCNENIDDVGTKTGCRPRTDSMYVEDPQRFVDVLRGVKPDARMVMAAAIIGPPLPIEVQLSTPPGGDTPGPALHLSCDGIAPAAFANAAPGLRIADFIYGLRSPESLALSMCTPDLHAQLAQIGRSLKKLIGDPCIDTASLADGSADPGIQPSCTAYDEAAGTRTELPACSADASGDCFELVADEAACPYVADHLRVRVQRRAQPSADAWTYVRCAI